MTKKLRYLLLGDNPLETQLAADPSADDKHPATISVDGEFE
jgi:hypothetical protein